MKTKERACQGIIEKRGDGALSYILDVHGNFHRIPISFDDFEEGTKVELIVREIEEGAQ